MYSPHSGNHRGLLGAGVFYADGPTEDVPADALYVMIGAHPHTDWLDGVLARDERGYVLTGRDVTAPEVR